MKSSNTAPGANVSSKARCASNCRWISLVFAAISFWVICLATSYGFAFPARLEAVGIWIGFTVGLGVYALLLVWRFNALTRHGYLPDLPGHAHA